MYLQLRNSSHITGKLILNEGNDDDETRVTNNLASFIKNPNLCIQPYRTTANTKTDISKRS